MGWLYLAATSCLVFASCYGAAISEEDAVGVSMCCPEGRVLKIVRNPAKTLGGWRKNRGDEYVPKCVRSRRAPKDPLDGSPIAVTDDEGSGDEKLVVFKKTGVMLPGCSLGLKYQMVSLKISGSDAEGSGSEDDESVPESSKRVKLGDYSCGRGKCRKGNVYVDDKPVCDDDWDDTDAEVVCRELGFTSGGYATQESYFGKVDLEKQSGFDQVRCSGRESSLVDCRHETFDDCGDSEGAGVVCYQDEDYAEEEYDSYRGLSAGYGDGESSTPSVALRLTSAGQLSIPGQDREGLRNTTYKAGEFCMAGVFEGEGEWEGKEMKEGEAIAVMCEPCKSVVLCSTLLLDLFGSFPGHEIEGDERSFGTNNVVLLGDKDADGKVNFDEFKAGIEDYVKKVFDFLDLDGDGSLDEGVSIKTLSAKFFLQILDEVFLFFDVNQDDIMSVEDAPPRAFRDRNADGKISLREVFGVSLINLPAPLYRLYATLDKDKNEKISIEEATNFIKGALHVIDQNEDCSIDIDEFIAALNESKLPKEFQLAVKLLLEYYFELGDFILRQFVSAADADGDKKTTLVEIIGLKDPAVLFSIATVAERLGMANGDNINFLVGLDRRYGYNGEKQEAVIEMWLNVLYDFVDNRKLQSVPADFCGLE